MSDTIESDPENNQITVPSALAASYAFDLHRRICTTKQEVECGFLALGALLCEMRETNGWQALGYDSWPQYLADPEVGMARSTASKLIMVHQRWVGEFGADVGKLALIGWKKLYLASTVAQPQDADEWLAKCETLAASDIEAEVRHINAARAPAPQPGRYGVVYADPDWQRDTPEWIASVKVMDRAAKDAELYMWCPPAMLHHALQTVARWGFQYRCERVRVGDVDGWPSAHVRMGHECLVVASRGQARPAELVGSFIGQVDAAEGRARVLADIDYCHGGGLVNKLAVFVEVERVGWSSWLPV